MRPSPSTRGAIGELRVAADLLARGRPVFEAASPASVCDLVYIDRRGHFVRVEVRTTTLNTISFGAKDLGNSDVLATIHNGGPIKYRRTPRRRAASYDQYSRRAWYI